MSTRTKTSVADLKSAARLLAKGHLFEDFSVGRVFEHHWGRTLSQAENSLFSSLTLHFNPHYFNSMHAAEHGHPVILLNPLLIFNTVFGLSVEDLSEEASNCLLKTLEEPPDQVLSLIHISEPTRQAEIA